MNQIIEKDKQIRDFIKTKEETKSVQQMSTISKTQKVGDTTKADLKSQRQDNLNELTNTEKSLKK